jgi:hypothetical protein
MPHRLRAAPPLAVALVLALACSREDVSECPGQPIGVYVFTFAADADGADLDVDGVPDDGDGDGQPDVTSGCVPRGDVPAGTFDPPAPGEPVDPANPGGPRFADPFDATLSADGTTVALCTGLRFADPRIGTREATAEGQALSFGELTSTGASVGQCGPRCPVTMRERLALLLAPDGSVPRGTLVDEFDVPVNAPGEDTYDCGSCGGTCRAVYEVSGALVP